MKKILFTFIIIFLEISFAQAQISFETNVSKKKFEIDEYITIHFILTIKNQDIKDMGGLKLPAFTNALIISSNIAQNRSFTEEDSNIEQIQEIVLKPIKSGELRIGSASINIDGKTYATKPITITVTKNNSVDNEYKENSIALRVQETFLELQVSNKTPFPNEGVPAKLKLYTRSFDLLNGVSAPPTLPNFKDIYINHILSKKRKNEYTQEVINGEIYLSKEIGEYLLFSTKPGAVTINPFSLELSLIDGFFEEKSITIKSSPVTLQVKNFPNNVPKGFTGIVGSYELEMIPNKKELKIHEPLTVQIIIKGKGNSKLIKIPELIIATEGIEKYTSLDKPKNIKTPEGVISSVSTSNILIPYKGGEFIIKSEPFSYFDLETKNYKTLTPKPITIKVIGDTIITPQNIEEVKSIKLKLIADSIKDLQNNQNPTDSSITLNNKSENQEKNIVSRILKDNNNQLYWVASIIFTILLIFILAVIYFFFFKEKRKSTKKETEKRKLSKKEKILSQTSDKIDINTELFKLKKIAEKEKEKIEFYRLLEFILHEAVKQNLNIPEEQNLTSIEIEDRLSNKFGDEYAEEYKKLLLKSHIERYSTLSDTDYLLSIYDKAERLVKELI